MNAADLKSILAKLPPDQQQSAKKRICVAETCGWLNVTLWEWGWPLSEMDLVGLDPRGDFNFLH